MVCATCQKKLDTHPCHVKGSTNTIASGRRKLNENKMLSKSKKWTPYASSCKICKKGLDQGYKYCQKCAYAKALCSMCGKQIMESSELKRYKQSTA